MTLFEALQALNDAAYASARASKSELEQGDMLVQKLYSLAWATDTLVDENAPGISEAKT